MTSDDNADTRHDPGPVVRVRPEPRPRTVGGIEVLPWREFLDALWAGEFR